MRELGADVVLVDERVERGRRVDRAVGLDLDRMLGQQREHPRERAGLQQRLAAGDDEARLAERGDARGGVLGSLSVTWLAVRS